MKENKSKIFQNIIISVIIVVILAVVIFLAEKYRKNEDSNVGDMPTKQNEVQEVDNFGVKFLKMENDKQNMIYSPLSIKYALKMLQEGAKGNTKIQIDEVVGDLKLTKYNNIDKVLSLANGVYIRDTYSKYVKPEYKDTLIQKYNAEINYDAFENANNVNSWIENKTFGIIKKMLADELVQDPECEMLLMNALAIDMEWDTSFAMEDTYGEPFYLENNEKLLATTMHKETSSDSIAYYKDKDMTALTMDLKEYENTNLEFMLMMPNNNLDEYVKTITLDKINNITNKLKLASSTKAGIKLWIPKFSFDYDLRLKQDLISLGITDAFDGEKANFSNMSDKPLFVSDALHKANIDFSEEGVKAAAVTVFIMKDSLAIGGEKPKPEEIRIDKPFLFFIRDKQTGEIWFTGTVYEPNSWENDKAEYYK